MRKATTLYLTLIFTLTLITLSFAKEKVDPVLTSLPPDQMPEPTRILVKFKQSIGQAKREEVIKEHNFKMLSKIEQIGVDVLEVDPADTADEALGKFKAKHNDKIEFAEVDAVVAPVLIPNDPEYTAQWHLPNISAPGAWDKSTGAGVTIAILDTGVDTTHPDLAPLAVAGWNIYDNNNNTADVHGHGTCVAGSAAAAGNNLLGVAGVSFASKIMPIRIADAAGYSYYSAVADGLTWAADHGARVANISFGPMNSSATVMSGAQYMRSKKGVSVFAAGNTGVLTTDAVVDYMTFAAATNPSNTTTGWSSFGDYVDIAAPGESIYTTAAGGSYRYISGTSFSSPITAGVYALMMSANPALSPATLDNILFTTATDMGTPGKDQRYGWGIVNASAAVTKALETVVTGDKIPPSVPTNLQATASGSTAVDLSWGASTDNVGVTSYKIYRNSSLLTTKSASVLTHRDTTISGGNSYSYEVEAFDAAGNVSARSNTASVSIPMTLQITSVSVPTKTGTGATIVWQTTLPATGQVLYGTTSTNLNMSSAKMPLATSQSVSLTGLNKKTTYYFKVVATDSTGAIVVNSAVSSFKTTPR